MNDLQLDIRHATIEGSIIDYLFDVSVPFTDQQLILTPQQYDQLMQESAADPRFNEPFDWDAPENTNKRLAYGSYRMRIKEIDEQGG